jgi:hypothetical protein
LLSDETTETGDQEVIWGESILRGFLTRGREKNKKARKEMNKAKTSTK